MSNGDNSVKNYRLEETKEQMGKAVGALFICFLLSGIFPTLCVLGGIGAFFYLMSNVFQYISVKSEGAASASIDAAPQVIQVIEETPAVFDSSGIPDEEPCVPYVEGGWLSISQDHAKLRSYAADLDRSKDRTARRIGDAISRIKSDRSKLLAQQLQILRRAALGKKALAHIADLPMPSLSVEKLPHYASLNSPVAVGATIPSVVSSKYQLIPGATGVQLGRVLTMNNTGGANILFAAAIAAAVAIRAKATVSKALRLLEEVRGQINVYNEEVRGRLAVLGRGHMEIVACSKKLKNAEREVMGLMSALENRPKDPINFEGLDSSTKAEVQQLWLWVVSADALLSRKAA